MNIIYYKSLNESRGAYSVNLYVHRYARMFRENSHGDVAQRTSGARAT